MISFEGNPLKQGGCLPQTTTATVSDHTIAYPYVHPYPPVGSSWGPYVSGHLGPDFQLV